MTDAPMQPTSAEGPDTRLSTGNISSQSYGALVWRRFRKSFSGLIGLVLVLALLITAIFAPFFAPLDPKAPNVAYAPPDRLSWHVPGDGPESGWRLWPVVFPVVESEDELDPITFQPIIGPDYANPRPLRFFVEGWEYSLFGIPMDTHFVGVADGSPMHLLGTDKLGRDILSRGIIGSRISLALALGCIALITLIGTFAGIISGYLGGKFDSWFQRFVEIILAFPQLPLYLALASLIPPESSTLKFMTFVVIVIVGLGWAQLSREVRSKTLALRQIDYVRAALAVGARDGRIIKPEAMDRGELLDRVMNNYRRFYMKKALFSYPWSGSGDRRRYLLGCLKAFLKAGFERKFYDLGKVDYWGPQSKKKVDFHFDRTRQRAPVDQVEWQTSHNRKKKGQAAAEAMACGGGKEQMDDEAPPRAPAKVMACGGGTQQMTDEEMAAIAARAPTAPEVRPGA